MPILNFGLDPIECNSSIFYFRFQAKEAEQELLRLEHAKLVAKMEKRREENRVIKVDGPPPPPPGANLPNLPKL